MSLSEVFMSVQLLIKYPVSYKQPNCGQFCTFLCYVKHGDCALVYSLWFVWKELLFVWTHRFVRPLQDRIGTSSESDAREWNVCPGNTWKWIKSVIQETLVLRCHIVAACLPFTVDKPHGHFAVPGRWQHQPPPAVRIYQQAEVSDRLGGYARLTTKVIHISKERAPSYWGSSTSSLDHEYEGTIQLRTSTSCLPVCRA